MVHKIVYYMIQGLIKLLIYYIIYPTLWKPQPHSLPNQKDTTLFPPLRGQASIRSRPFACTELEDALSLPMADILPIVEDLPVLVLSGKKYCETNQCSSLC